MNFQELIKNRIERSLEDQTWVDEICVDESAIYEQGALMAREAIIELLLKINDENYNNHGEYINQSCRDEAETIERLINLIKYGNEYE